MMQALMKTPRVKIWDELTYLNPSNMDAGDYWDLAQEMLNNSKHPAWRHLSDELRKELNPKDSGF